MYFVIQIGTLAMCVVIFKFNTTQESSEIFEKFSLKENYRFSMSRKSVSGFSAKPFPIFLY